MHLNKHATISYQLTTEIVTYIRVLYLLIISGSVMFLSRRPDEYYLVRRGEFRE